MSQYDSLSQEFEKRFGSVPINVEKTYNFVDLNIMWYGSIDAKVIVLYLCLLVLPTGYAICNYRFVLFSAQTVFINIITYYYYSRYLFIT